MAKAPTIKVVVGFQTTTGFGTPFQLDSATYGVLDTNTLGGLAFADLTSLVENISVTRGRNRAISQFEAGTATVTFNNSSRILDPLNRASIYYPYVLPRCPIIISANGIPIFTGIVSDWNLDYDLANQDRMYASCTDDFTTLAKQALNEFTPSSELSSARVSTVLARPEVNYQGAQAIGTGSSTLGAYLIPQDTNVLDYLQQITTSEQGYLFMAANGALTFKGRTEVLNFVSGVMFNTDGTGLPYQTLVNQYGDELLYNYIVTQSPAGGPYKAFDATSQALYQSQQYSITDLLNSSASEVESMGQYILGKYKDPVLRFTGLSTELASLTNSQQNTCLNLDMTQIVQVIKTFATGTPSTNTQNVIISGVNHTIVPGSHIISYTFESTTGNAYFTLDDAIFGILDQNLLAF